MKHCFERMVSIAAVVATIAIADETFNGIGIAITPAEKGAEVVSVIPGTPAADSKLQKGDVIISVNGNSTYCKKMDVVQNLLRGEKNKPVEIVFIRNGDTLETTVRRAKLTVRTFTFELESAGEAVVTVTNSSGVVVSSVRIPHAVKGFNRTSWDSSNAPADRYVVSVEHRGFTNGKSVLLK